MENRIQPVAKRQTALALSLGLLLVTLLALLLMWQQSPPELAQALDPLCTVDVQTQPSATCGMSLGVELASGTPDCVVGPPAKCTFAVDQPFILTINTAPSPLDLIAGFAAEVLFGNAPELGPCDNIRDDDGDRYVNDGCVAVGDPEVGRFCDNATDDEDDQLGVEGHQKDGLVNDGCPQVGAISEFDQCAGNIDDDGDGFVNDGCPQVGTTAETGDQCANDTEDDSSIPFLDGFINDGCPAVGDPEINQCGNATNDDPADDPFVNDGCPVVGVTEAGACDGIDDDDNDGAPNDGCPAVGPAEVGSWCADDFDDDQDGFVNDGCPLAGLPETACAGIVDDDSDGRINDGCPMKGGLAYARAASCADEVQVARKDESGLALCNSFDTIVFGGAAFSVLSSFSSPLPHLDVPANSTTTTLVKMSFTCNIPGSHLLVLTADPDSTEGAIYSTTSGATLLVKTVEVQLDLNFDLLLESHQVADTLTVHCGEPSPPTPTPTPPPTLTATPVVTVGPTSTPGPSPTPTATSPAGPTATPTEAPSEEPDVALTMTDSADPVESEGKITYTLQVRNLGLQAAENVEVTDILPAGATFLGPALGCSHVAGVVTCTVPSLGGYDGRPGGLDEETIFIQIAAPEVTADFERIVNEAWVSASNEPPENGGNNNDVEETIVLGQGPDLTVEKIVSPSFLDVGGTVDYTVTVRNVGPVAAEGVELQDTLPPLSEATFVSASEGCAEASGVVTCALGSLPPDGQISIQLQLSVPDVTQDLLLRNEARVSAANERFWDTGNNLAVVHTSVVAPPPELTLEKSGPASILRARTFTYTLTLTNQGGGDAIDVLLTDTLPAAIVLGDPLFEGADCVLSAGPVLTCDIPLVAAHGGQAIITVSVRAPNVTAEDVEVRNDVDAVDPDEGLALNDSVVTLVSACVDLTDDGFVAFGDILALLSVSNLISTDPNFDPIYDLVGDGVISFRDFLLLQSHLGDVC